MRMIAAGLLASWPLLLAAQETAPPPRRDSWYIGFGIAGGSGQVTNAAGTATFKQFLGGTPATVGFNFKVGGTLTPRLLLGFDLTGVNSATNEADYKASIRIVNYDAMLTWFPVGRGPFLRGGFGLSRFSYDLTLGGSTAASEFTGTNLAAGLGYAFWLGSSFNLTVNLDVSGQSWGDHDGGTTGPRSSSFWALGLGFDWY